MIRTISLLRVAPFIVLAILAAPARGDVPNSCPAPAAAALMKAYPRATIVACKPETARGKDFIEAKLTTSAGAKIEVDVTRDGTILQVEEDVAVGALPDAVKKAFAAKYPKAKATAASKQTAGKDVRYEIAFRIDDARREATFSADGAFVEEE